ncbi:MAG TPA: nucleoside-diphosphate kinase [Candidatus Dojkabacteria bacterium]|nr:nucleoside-diphosphate kinase [Candidatus Dojkabacteria bacterium]
MQTEITLIIVKHDGVARGLMGQIISRFEKVGLKLIALEFIQSTEDMGKAHYPGSKKWLETAGNRTLDDYQRNNIDPKEVFGTDKASEIGRVIKNWLVEYLAAGPVLAMVWEGPGAVVIGRKLCGDTIPAKALPGTIRGDFAIDNVDLANKQGRPIYNVVHASGEVAEAESEIELWFDKNEIFDYKTYTNKFSGTLGKLGKV